MWWRGIFVLGRHCQLSLPYYLPSQDRVDSSKHFCLFRKMGLIAVFTVCITILAVYGTVICFRCLFPCHIIPKVSALLNDVDQCLTSAVKTGAIPAVNEYRATLENLASDLARMRIESHRSPGFFQQIWLAFRCNLTYRLYSLASQIGAVKMRVEIVMDEHRLALPTTPQIVIVPPPGAVVVPMLPPIMPVN
ncbi:hypothetical protein BJY52DRAFT_721149 [Lactarius psammicola]|nr:hypothetical protein BJY52DRAFT_721149 [Lactarius psammicola]